ncbi:hypothetical protein DYB25_003942 [Aphanomyces astaci]|uniref:Kinesin motor domain-containing protein n=1 Tax=Aphanomyces astaci TaxID=112090 RepID=A0A397BJ09_APHAT|nr:hypothetical protein DYB25_003942 [Aphanomyces astaci]
MNALEYNYTGKMYFDVSKNRSHKSIYGTAKDIIHDALPIQCLEAVFLAAYLTAGGPEYEGATFNHQIDRIPISFKTSSGGTTFRHIVLAIKHQSLSDLVGNFVEQYTAVCHDVIKVYVGFPFSHDIHSTERVEWRVLVLIILQSRFVRRPKRRKSVEMQCIYIDYSHLHRVGDLPDSFADKFPLHKPPKRECDGFAMGGGGGGGDVEEDVPTTKLPDLLLRVTPEVLHFKPSTVAAGDDTNNRPPDLVEFGSVNLYLNNLSRVHHLVVYVVVSDMYLQILGKPFVLIPSDGRKGCQFSLKPGSVTSTAIRLVLPANVAQETSGRTASFQVQYAVVSVDDVAINDGLGLIPRFVEKVFEACDAELENAPHDTFQLSCTYMECRGFTKPVQGIDPPVNNKSLATLTTCMTMLAKSQRRILHGNSSTIIPFRESVLTRLLQPFVQGASRVTFVLTLSQSATSLDDTCTTLRFAERLRSISCKPTRNPIVPVAPTASLEATHAMQAAVVHDKALMAENDRLRIDLHASQSLLDRHTRRRRRTRHDDEGSSVVTLMSTPRAMALPKLHPPHPPILTSSPQPPKPVNQLAAPKEDSADIARYKVQRRMELEEMLGGDFLGSRDAYIFF